MKLLVLSEEEVRIILCVLTADNMLYKLVLYDCIVNDNNINPILIERIEKELGIEIVDYWLRKEI